jgi:hypothetical protein
LLKTPCMTTIPWRNPCFSRKKIRAVTFCVGSSNGFSGVKFESILSLNDWGQCYTFVILAIFTQRFMHKNIEDGVVRIAESFHFSFIFITRFSFPDLVHGSARSRSGEDLSSPEALPTSLAPSAWSRFNEAVSAQSYG